MDKASQAKPANDNKKIISKTTYREALLTLAKYIIGEKDTERTEQ